jgi:YVTN family beta-propeller protein
MHSYNIVNNWIPKILLWMLTAAGASAQPYAYVSGFSNSVTIVNIATGTVASTINLSGTTSGLAVTPDEKYLYVTEQAANTVQIISLATKTVVATVGGLASLPTEVFITPNGAQAYVLSRGTFQIGVINTATHALTNISVASKPMQLVFSADGSLAYVALYGGSIAVINTATNTVVNTIAASYGLSAIALANGHLYAADQSAGSVTVFGLSGNVVTTITGLGSPDWLASTPDGSRVFVTSGTNAVSVISTASNAVSATIPVGSLPTSIAVSADGAYAYVTNEYGFSLSQISVATNTVVKTFLKVMVYPYSVVTSPGSGGTPPPTCSYSLSGSSNSFSVAGGAGSVNVTAPSSCGWIVSNIPAWVSLSSGIGPGNGTVNFTVASNSGTAARSATLNIAGLNYLITEAGATAPTCTYSLSATGASFTSSGGAGSVNVTAPSGCSWSLTNVPAWVTVGSSSGSGSATVSFTVGSNSSTASISANLNIAGWSYLITEAGSSSTGKKMGPDFDHNGIPDLVWQQVGTNMATVWYMTGADGSTMLSTKYLSGAMPGWSVVAIADVNADGNPDLVWEQDGTNAVSVWYMGGADGSTTVSQKYLSGPIAGWRVVGMADLDGNGHPDLIWQQATTNIAGVWYMGGSDGSTMLSTKYLSGSMPGQRIVAVTDLNADGHPDLVWQDGTNAVSVWYMSGADGSTSISQKTLSGPIAGWRVVGMADLDLNGHPDLIWQQDSTNTPSVWYMGGSDGSTMLSAKYLGGPVAGWRVMGPK